MKGAPDKRLRLAVSPAPPSGAGAANAGGPGLGACGYFYPNCVTWAFGVQGAVVRGRSRDVHAGLLRHVAMHDCGRPINPMVVEGQIHGGIAQGMGSAMPEEVVHDAQGQLVTGSLMDYAIPRAADFPALDVVHLDFPSTVNPSGSRASARAASSRRGRRSRARSRMRWPIRRRDHAVPVTPARVFEALRATGRWPRSA